MKYELITLLHGPKKAIRDIEEGIKNKNLYISFPDKWELTDQTLPLEDSEHLDMIDMVYKRLYSIGIPEEPLIEFKTKKYRQYKSKFEFAANNQKFGPYLITNDREQLYIITSIEDDEVELDRCIKQDYLSLQFGYKHYNALTGETHVCGVRV